MNYPQEQMSMWLMKIYQKDELISMFERFGFKLTYHKDHFRDSLESSANFWLNNIDKLTPNEKTHHINVLEKSYRDNKKYLEITKKEVKKYVGKESSEVIEKLKSFYT